MNIDTLLSNYLSLNSIDKTIRFESANFDKENLIIKVMLTSSSVLSESELNDFNIYLNNNVDFSPFKTIVEYKKIVVDFDMAYHAIVDYIKGHFFNISCFFKQDKIEVEIIDGVVNYKVGVISLVKDSFGSVQVNDIDNHLSRDYCCDFKGEVYYYDDENDEIIKDDVYHYDTSVPDRYFTLKYVNKFTDETENYKAIYIVDGKDKLGEVVFAGYVKTIEKKESKSGREYYLINIDDKTGSVEGRYFCRDKAKCKKVDQIAPGSVISLRGINELYEGNVSFMIKGINLCEFPDTPLEEKASKKAPLQYLKIFPTKAEILKQGSLFEEVPQAPANMIGKTYTVVDVETTGKSSMIDKVTEIGAVKVVDGVITEQWTTLLNPGVKIDEKIVQLTGIDDELVKDCPSIEEVFPDFFKYIEGTEFVGHNVEFDFGFLSKAGKDNGYILTNPLVDTLEMSRRLIKGLKNYKLNTVCEVYDIQFNHHRALADAYATAELLIHLKRKELESNN